MGSRAAPSNRPGFHRPSLWPASTTPGAAQLSRSALRMAVSATPCPSRTSATRFAAAAASGGGGRPTLLSGPHFIGLTIRGLRETQAAFDSHCSVAAILGPPAHPNHFQVGPYLPAEERVGAGLAKVPFSSVSASYTRLCAENSKVGRVKAKVTLLRKYSSFPQNN